MDTELQALLDRLVGSLERIEARLSDGVNENCNWGEFLAYRWTRTNTGKRALTGITHDTSVSIDDLLGIDRPRDVLSRNTEQFVRGLPANNALIWGPRGTGKSTLVRACLNTFGSQGLRLIELGRDQLQDLWEILQILRDRAERFILFIDDLSFEANDADYKALKAVVDGSVSGLPENVLIYATSNRRHLMPEMKQDNEDAHILDGELHFGEAVEEKTSLSERFGLWLALHPFSQDLYLQIVAHWLKRLGQEHDEKQWREQALRWALLRGSRSGRSAWQFAREYSGRQQLKQSSSIRTPQLRPAEGDTKT